MTSPSHSHFAKPQKSIGVGRCVPKHRNDDEIVSTIGDGEARALGSLEESVRRLLFYPTPALRLIVLVVFSTMMFITAIILELLDPYLQSRPIPLSSRSNTIDIFRLKCLLLNGCDSYWSGHHVIHEHLRPRNARYLY